MLRKFSAHYIFTGTGQILKRGIVTVDDVSGVVVDVKDTGGILIEEAGLEFYDGIIVPGFVNAHCHLELSYLREKIAPHHGLVNFVGEVGRFRDFHFDPKAIAAADAEMWRNGIVAVGDISNSTDSFSVKKASKIDYTTFVEVFGVQDSVADSKMALAKTVFQKLKADELKGHVVPHAPYSVSEKLWQLLIADADANNSVWSIHNQECEAENLLFTHKIGDFVKFLSHFTSDFLNWETNGRTSLQHCAKYFWKARRILLVHNTFTNKLDLEALGGMAPKTFLVLCPNANLYIENRLPNVEILAESGISIALGTDSLASNSRLSILEEMKTLQLNFPQLKLNDLISWATLNGAKALGVSNEYGSIEVGKKPGLKLISGIDYTRMCLTSESVVNVLV